MRSTLLAIVISLTTVACVGTIDGTTPDPGNPPGMGSNPDPGSGSDPLPTPLVTATFDKPTVQTELFTTEMVTVTVTGSQGFSGNVAINPTLLDAQNNPITTWTVTATPPSVTLPLNGSMTSIIAVQIPSDSAALAATLKVATQSSAAESTATSAFTVQQQLHISMAAGTGTATPHAHPGIPTNLNVKTGTQVIFINDDTIAHRIHGDNGVAHEPDDLAPGGTYQITMTNDGQWYCHDHGGDPARQISVVP